MKSFFAENLVAQSVKEGLPWDFQMTEAITEQIRHDKTERQLWYNNPATAHSFYSFIEGVNSNLRVSRENNPPYVLHGFAADYDTLQLSKERILEAVATLPIKPTYIERSLGGNWRLVWVFPRPLFVSSYEFCQAILRAAVKWLSLDILPCFDEKAFTSPTRLLCNGCQWEKVGDSIPEAALQSFFVKQAQEHNAFKASSEDNNVPLDVVEKAIREKYSNFDWPSAFEENSQGPSFWIPESASPMSAIVKRGGMVTFSAHATKQFYPWSDILGPEFARKWSDDAIFKATDNTFWDGKSMWWPAKDGIYAPEDRIVLQNRLLVNCNLSPDKDKQTKKSQIDLAINHIYVENKIHGAGPHTFQRPGLIIYQGKRCLNTYSGKPLEPATGSQKFGPQGNFPFSSAMLMHMLGFESEKQFWHFIAWWQHYYRAAIEWCPMPGQNIFIAGLAKSGKTYVNRNMVGVSVGGFVDASDYFLGISSFNAYMLEVAHWVLDDDTPSGSQSSIMKTAALLKKVAANQDILSNAKFLKQTMVAWSGRVGTTLNLDSFSTRVIPPMDDGTRNKTNIYRCNPVLFNFPNRLEQARLTGAEMPFLCRWLLDVAVPDYIEKETRYGIMPYHDEALLDQAHQSQTIAPFKEVLIEVLSDYFGANPGVTEWKGTITQILRMLLADLKNEQILRGIKLEQSNRLLEQIQKEGLIECDFDTGKLKTRVWRFPRSAFVVDNPIAPPSEPEATGAFNPFNK